MDCPRDVSLAAFDTLGSLTQTQMACALLIVVQNRVRVDSS